MEMKNASGGPLCVTIEGRRTRTRLRSSKLQNLPQKEKNGPEEGESTDSEEREKKKENEIREMEGKVKQNDDDFTEDSSCESNEKRKKAPEVRAEIGSVHTPAPSYPITRNQTIIDTTKPYFSRDPVVGSYFITRKTRAHLRSQRFYVLKSSVADLMFAKEHGVIIPDVYINENANIHIKTKEYLYKMTTNMRKSVYSVCEGEHEVASIEYDNDYGEVIGPRKIHIKAGDVEFRSKIPKRGNSGAWKLSFGGHYTIPSCRNAILCDTGFNEAIVIRKVDKDMLELTVKQPTILAAVMAFAVSSYIYKE